MRISVLGAGNVATNLALALKKAGHEIVQIYNRSDDAGKELAKTVAANFTSDIDGLSDADIYIVAVKDDAIEALTNQIDLNGKVIAHTSATKPKHILTKASENYGIFYPLQTIKKSFKVDFKNVPILVDGSNKETTKKLEILGHTISQNVHHVDDERRLWIHVAAVFANNFTNHLMVISENILQKHGMNFEILRPLVISFITNLSVYSPNEIQTGPAARRDNETIERHLQLLADEPKLQQMYRILTDSIIANSSSRA